MGSGDEVRFVQDGISISDCEEAAFVLIYERLAARFGAGGDASFHELRGAFLETARGVSFEFSFLQLGGWAKGFVEMGDGGGDEG